MFTTTNSVIIEPKDNVAVAIEELKPGMKGCCTMPDGNLISIEILEKIPVYHKFAIQHISLDTPIIKYGEHIGYAVSDIKKGQHVHVHNIIGRREDLRLK